MGIEIIGIRRLYDALGCDLVTEKEIQVGGPICIGLHLKMVGLAIIPSLGSN